MGVATSLVRYGLQQSAKEKVITPLADWQTQRSMPLNGIGLGGKPPGGGAGRLSCTVAPESASHPPAATKVPAGQTCWHWSPGSLSHFV
jgi:hypothetical protein